MSIYEEIQTSILDGEAQDTVKLIKQAIALRYPPENVLEEGLIKGINLVADKFKTESVLIPEVLVSTRAVHAGISILKPYLEKKENKKNIKIVMGVVAGDLHDIGKNIVKTLISTLAVEVIDLGIDVDTDRFIETVKNENPDILILSALLTTTMPEIKKVIDELKKRKLRKEVVIFIGGAPISQKFKKDVGADYYIEDAMELRTFLGENLNKFKRK
jgi:methanogenic corrinoid protein MtbC1